MSLDVILYPEKEYTNVPSFKTVVISKLFFLGLLVACSNAGDVGPTPDSALPEPEFLTDDIDLFWQIYDQANFRAENFQTNYIDAGSQGLQDYADQKNLALGLENTLSNYDYQQYYNAVRPNTLDLSDAIAVSHEAFIKLKNIYPRTEYYRVYFLIGAMSAGGRISENGLLIAAEMFTKPDTTSLRALNEWHQSVLRNQAYLPSIVVHEFIHMQQQFKARKNGGRSLLEQSIVEGMADFVAYHLMPDQPFMNEHLHAFGDPIEEELWDVFNREKDKTYNDTEWLYTGSTTSAGYPADMGYYVGFKILESYAGMFVSTDQAIAEMLSTRNYEKIFERSNYAEKFD